jgi:orotidine-5'-phosphate decarboxylase
MTAPKIIVALDGFKVKEDAINLAQALKDKVWGFKVNDLLIRHGCNIIYELKKCGNVFADPKLYDIPNTVQNSVKILSSAGADFISVHASGGLEMLKAAVDASGQSKILAVTMLTSMSMEEVRETYRGFPLERFSEMFDRANVHGIVCGGKEVDFWSLFDLIKVVPGVRPFGVLTNDDQKRITSTEKVKADYLVIGRPITASKDPLEAVAKINSMYSA